MATMAKQRTVNETFLKPDECQQILRISEPTFYRWIRSGTLPHVRFGRTIRIPASWLTAKPTAK